MKSKQLKMLSAFIRTKNCILRDPNFSTISFTFFLYWCLAHKDSRRLVLDFPLIISIMFSFLFLPNLLAYPSVFFTEKEVKLIQINLSLKNKLKETIANSERLSLSSIIYVDKDHWTLWLNEQAIHADDPHHFKGFEILKVTPFSVEFSCVRLHSTISTRITLRPHQIFLVKENKIISEGISTYIKQS